MKKTFFMRTLIYCALFIGFLAYGYRERPDYSIHQLYIGNIALTSAVFLSIYCGLKGAGFRLKKESSIRKWIEKIHVPWKEILFHIIVIFVSIAIMSFSEDSSIVQEKEVDKALLTKIENEFGRTDIKSIVEVDNKYVITFLDKSVKIMPIKR